MPQTLGDLVDVHFGRAALVMGGGVSLPADFERAREMYPDAVLLSCNHHGTLLGVRAGNGTDLFAVRRTLGEKAPILAESDYMVHLDEIEKFRPQMLGPYRSAVSPRMDADVRLLAYPRGTGYTGMVAAWFAFMLGCGPVVLCGMDCYAGGCYWHSPGEESPGQGNPVKTHVKEWRQHMGRAVPLEVLRAASGPLVPIFGEVEPGIPCLPVEKRYAEKTVVFTIRTTVRGEIFHADEIGRFEANQAEWLVENERATWL